MAGTREKRRADRRRSIVDAALLIVVRDGVDALTMPGLAKELGIAVGGLYRYFESKDRLIGALEIDAIDAYADYAEGRLAEGADLTDTPEDVRTLALFWRTQATWIDFSQAEPVLYRLLEAVTSDPRNLIDETLYNEIQEHVRPILSRVASAIEAAVAAGALVPGDSAVRVHILWGALLGIGLFRKLDRRRPPLLGSRLLAEEAVSALLLGWGAKPQCLTAARDLS